MGYPGKSVDATLDDFNWEKSYKAIPAHMNTVVANETLVSYVTEKSSGKYNVYGLNPGLIYTEIRDNYLGKGTYLSYFVESLVSVTSQTAETYAEKVLVHVLASAAYENTPKFLFENNGSGLDPNPKLTDEVKAKIISESDRLLTAALQKKI